MQRGKRWKKIKTFKADVKGDRFCREDGKKFFLDKNYRMYGKAFIQVELTPLNSYKLLKAVWID